MSFNLNGSSNRGVSTSIFPCMDLMASSEMSRFFKDNLTFLWKLCAICTAFVLDCCGVVVIFGVGGTALESALTGCRFRMPMARSGCSVAVVSAMFAVGSVSIRRIVKVTAEHTNFCLLQCIQSSKFSVQPVHRLDVRVHRRKASLDPGLCMRHVRRQLNTNLRV